ncbi:hypothetical protein ACFO0N_01460 [Halobium salinum]|uniref:DUF7344 domain-containing protein n=1 Tax=Halobium salinum TaxID=1364940 RepID=A0ABD5P783_9EURY|nr:hypothetical protein [Halobium salinum]
MDDLFAVLKNDRRRETVRFVAGREGPTPLADIATHVAEGSASESASYRSAYVSLQQSHLPLLVEYGVVEYDPEEKLVSRGPTFESVVDYLAESPTGDDGGWRLDLGVAGTGLTLLVVDQFGVVGLGETGTVAVAVSTLAALCALNVGRLLGWVDR